ncbi:hypothetical protein HPP92_024026 [Vanilla planifolia]|uniref:Uncharacterized protein n=1 Tax=Vanilla planifolia TaxID=51239 RepID=A0A835U9J2_VANPL|nr:hypothetical protein HPP92_024026 [Vanilla planifolia]
MRRDSRHKSHRSHKHSSRDARGRSDSEDDGSSRDRRQREDEVGAGAGARVSRDVEEEKRKASSSVHASQEKERHGMESGDISAERSGKRKEREEESCTPERWSGGGKEDVLTEKGNRKEDLGLVHYHKAEKITPVTVETKSKSSRRREGSLERYADSSARSESAKRRSEKEHSRRESRDEKERDMERGSDRDKERDRATEREKKSQDYRHRRSGDAETRTQSSRKLGAEDERTTKKDTTDLDKDSERYLTKRRSGSNSTDKWHDDGKNNDDKRVSSRDDFKNESHKVEGHKDEHYKDDRYREKYYRDTDRDQRHRDTRHRDERYSRDYTSDRLDSKSKDRDKPPESYSKKSKLHGSEREVSPHAEDYGAKSRDSRVQKRSYDENDEHDGLKQKSAKEPRAHVEKNSSHSSKLDHRYQGKDDTANNLPKRSVSPKARSSKDQSRRGLKQSEYGHKEPVLDDRIRPTEERDKVSMDHERVSESFSSEKMRVKDRMNSDDREHVSVSQSPFKRSGHFSSTSPVHIPAQPPVRHSIESPSIYADESRIKSADRRSNGHSRRIIDPNIERGQQGMAWKNGPTWPSAVPNGFIPFQHGPPAHGFHSALQQFPPPSLFGARPYIEMNQSGFPYMHESDRFSGHGHPFGWHPTDDSCPPQLQGWDANNPLFGDKSKVHVRPDWDPNRHLLGGRGWDLNTEMWKGQNPNLNVESSAAHEMVEKPWTSFPGMLSKSNGEEEHLQLAQDGTTHLKQLSNSPDNNSRETTLEIEHEKAHLPGKTINDDRQNLCNYLSKIDVTFDLVPPELCEEIRSLLLPCNVSDKEELTNNGVQILAKGSNFGSLLPKTADTAFKRAMSVYWKQNHGKKVKFCSKQEKSANHTADMNDLKTVTASAPPSELLPEKAGPLEEEEDGLAADGDIEEVGDDAGDEKLQSDVMSGGVVLMESSEACDGVMPDCKVSLNRIHNPSESTH